MEVRTGEFAGASATAVADIKSSNESGDTSNLQQHFPGDKRFLVPSSNSG
jgi:hypothetical protein